MHDIDEMIYHIVKRVPGMMQIMEHAFDYIDIENLSIIPNRGNVNNTYFTDGKHTYHFSNSKNTLYMLFEDMEILDSFEVEIMTDPYDFLMNIPQDKKLSPITSDFQQTFSKRNKICLRLYSTKRSGDRFVPERSGLNQWNASGRRRHPSEVYIPYPAIDRERTVGFFPERNTVFSLTLPDGTTIPAKVCQEDGKAIMSNPNKILGEWLLRKVFELPERTIITYQMLEKFGIDSVIFTKKSDLNYYIDFAEIGTYEKYYELSDNDNE
jgi:hypothetical protein